MEIHDMLSNSPVSRFRMFISDKEDQVESGQDGGLEIDILAWGLGVHSVSFNYPQYSDPAGPRVAC